MPSGVYKRNKSKQASKMVNKYELVIANMDTINLILDLVKTIKKNKVGNIK